MDIIIEGNRVRTNSKFDNRMLAIVGKIEGQKKWLMSGAFSFEATAGNLSLWRATFPQSSVEGEAPSHARAPTRHEAKKVNLKFKTVPYPGQLKAFEKLKDMECAAMFMEMGTGKSKVAIDIAAYRYLAGRIKAFLIVAPKGVHEQWVETQIPLHMPEAVEYKAQAWNGKSIHKAVLTGNMLNIFTINPDAMRTFAGESAVKRFIDAHQGKVLMLLDESHLFKKNSTKRTKKAIEFGRQCSDRMLASGTPIGRDLTDLFSQFRFLNEAILGHRYVTTYRQEYCVMGGWMNKSVVGHKNIDGLYRKIDPYTFRMTKDELGLPEKRFMEHHFELTDEQRSIMRDLKDSFLHKLDEEGTRLTVTHAATLLVRLQQISCGYVPSDDGETFKEIENPRLEAILDIIDQFSGKTVIWARFNRDIELICEALGDAAVPYYGPIAPRQRAINKERYLKDDKVRFFVASPATAGTGTDGLQNVTENVIYYSQSFNAIERWQSEDRTHRIGSKISTLYIDLIGRGSVDAKIVRNLRNKKGLSDLTLDEIRRMVELEQ